MSKKAAGKAQVMGTLIKIDGVHSGVVRDGKSWDLDDLRKLVGGYIELIQLPNGSKVMLADEDGNMKQLKPNKAASEYAGRAIVGDVVIIERRDLE